MLIGISRTSILIWDPTGLVLHKDTLLAIMVYIKKVTTSPMSLIGNPSLPQRKASKSTQEYLKYRVVITPWLRI